MGESEGFIDFASELCEDPTNDDSDESVNLKNRSDDLQKRIDELKEVSDCDR